MDLAETIKQYYFNNLSSLSEDKKFHFASRIAAWQGDPKAYQHLVELHSYMFRGSSENLSELLKNLVNQPQVGKRNADELRQPYFQKYPRLWGVHLALFRVRHLNSIYGVDASDNLFGVVSREILDEMAEALINDEGALRILSTFAVNYLYLYKQIILGDKEFIKPAYFLEISQNYDLSNEQHLQLMIYLFTHCVIGESNFYTKGISGANLPTYQEMLKVLETLIRANFQNINLDNKLEFLVCCRICNFDTDLFERVYDECKLSLSDDGHFLIDTHNTNKQESRRSFETSEHRNVLYIMSCSSYSPHDTLVIKG